MWLNVVPLAASYASRLELPSPSIGDGPAWVPGPIGPSDVPSDLSPTYPSGLSFQVGPWEPEPLAFAGSSVMPDASPRATASAASWPSWIGGGMSSLWTSLFDQADDLAESVLPILRESNRASEERARLSAQRELALLAAERGQSYQLPAGSSGPALLPWGSGLGDLGKYVPLLIVLFILARLLR